MVSKRTRAEATKLRETPAEGRAFGLELENLIGYNLRRAHGVQKQRFTTVFGPLGIRPVTLSLLGMVYDHPGIQQAELGKRLHIKRANMVPLLTELGARGFIARRPSASDGRVQLVTLTPAGKKLTAKLLEMHERLEADLVRTLGPRESEQLLQLLKKVRQISPEPELLDAD